MPPRTELLVTNEIYHIFNRTVGKEQIFTTKRNIQFALELIKYYSWPQKLRYSRFKSLSENLKADYLLNIKSQTPLVDIYCFALMPNHYHFLLKQLRENGVKSFTSNIQNSFARYFNIRMHRNGSLFQDRFKAKRVEDDSVFMHISRYIHLNPVTSFLINLDQLGEYSRTSFKYYTKNIDTNVVNISPILGLFGTSERYIEFVSDQVDYQRNLASIKHLIFE